jgi:hypothetical protein
MKKKKGRWSFVGKKHTLKIDDDLWQITQQYVKDQLAILTRHNDAPNPPMTIAEFEDLAYDVARHPQMIRNLQAQIKRKQEREAAKARKAGKGPEFQKMKWWDGTEVNAD